MKKLGLFSVATLLCLVGCSRNYNGATSQNFTLGAVQMKIHRGMSDGDVAEALGAPNIVTKDSDGYVTWIYDKVGTEISYEEKGGGFWLFIIGSSKVRGNTQTNQRTLTAVVKFDANSRVDNITYHSSTF